MVSLMLTVGSLFFIILLMIIYFSKRQFLSLKNRLYRYILVSALVMNVTEIVSTVTALNTSNLCINLLLSRIHWATSFPFIIILYYYSICLLYGITEDNLKTLIKSSRKLKKMTVFFIISFVLYFLIPFLEKISTKNITYVPSFVSYYVFTFCAVTVIAITLETFRCMSMVEFRKWISDYIMILELILMLILQTTFKDVAFCPIAATVQIYLLYFNIENPDLKIANELALVKDNIEHASKAKSDFL